MAFLRVLGEEPQHQGVHLLRYPRVRLFRWGWRLRGMLHSYGDRILIVEGHSPGYHLVEDHPQRVQITLRSYSVTLGLLGREVTWGAQDQIRFGHGGGLSCSGYAKVSHFYGTRRYPLRHGAG